MYKLFYLPLHTLSRAAKVVLAEKKIESLTINEPIWKRRIDFLKINPEGSLPVIIDINGKVIVGVLNLVEYLDDTKVGDNLIGKDPEKKLEVRRIFRWIESKMHKEVVENIIEERVFKKIMGKGGPSSEALKVGRINLENHLKYFEWILNKRTYLAGEFFSAADILYAATLSSLDYLGEVKWEKFAYSKKWYAHIKSRPSFRELLNEKIYDISPSKNYKNLDF